MTRPLSTYFISLWLAISLIGLPLHNQALLLAQFGPYLTLFFLGIALLAAVLVSYQFLQCHPAFVELTLWILSVQLGYLLTRFIWLLLHGGFATFPLPFLLVMMMDLYSVIYLMTPATHRRIAKARDAIRGTTKQPPRRDLD